MTLPAFLTKRYRFKPPDKRKALKWTSSHMHPIYYGAAAFEAHGFYSVAAGVLCVAAILANFVGEEV